jgi:hypothetical protein
MKKRKRHHEMGNILMEQLSAWRTEAAAEDPERTLECVLCHLLRRTPRRVIGGVTT